MLASLLAASLQSAAVAQPKSGGTLVYGVTGEPPSTDCHAITTYAAVHVLAPHYSLLLKVDRTTTPS
jgi:peptide/nickel transport system substrate-binding protein